MTELFLNAWAGKERVIEDRQMFFSANEISPETVALRLFEKEREVTEVSFCRLDGQQWVAGKKAFVKILIPVATYSRCFVENGHGEFIEKDFCRGQQYGPKILPAGAERNYKPHETVGRLDGKIFPPPPNQYSLF